MQIDETTYRKVTGHNPPPRSVTHSGPFRKQLFVPVALFNPLNQRMHWATKSRLANKQKELVQAACRVAQLPRPDADAVVTVYACRQYTGQAKCFDEGGLWAAMKWVEDALAEWLGVDDGEPRWHFIPSQAKVKSATAAGVAIEVIA